MIDKFSVGDIYDKNINFLVGSGASFGLFPTLALDIKDADGSYQTIETLATKFDELSDKSKYTLLFMHYYKSCIEPVLTFDLDEAVANPETNKVIKNYELFLSTLLTILQRRKTDKKCNVFTTNYDGCFTHVADDILKRGNEDFIVNDGTRGFSKRYLQARNFNSVSYQTGVFERHNTEVPQINLIHLHGSAYWYQDADNIIVNYSKKNSDRLVNPELFLKLEGFSNLLIDDSKLISDIPTIDVSQGEYDQFWGAYNKLPIVNPTKWKFHETVFEEHYYQMLRLLSYELEKPNSIFIVFGFSFADEHILNLVKRSLANPSLQIFICCFNATEQTKIQELFKLYKNVKCLTVDGFLDFSAFNKEIFTLTPDSGNEPENLAEE